MIRNKKHKRFVEEYLNNGLNGSKAYQTIYGSDTRDTTARVGAARILAKPEVKAYVKKQQDKILKDMRITREDILKRLNSRSLLMEEVTKLSLKDTLTENEEKKLQRLQNIIRVSDANKSDEMIAKMLGFNEPEKVDVSVRTFKANFGQ